MIRIHKHEETPLSLLNKQYWTGEDVIEQLKADQSGKCYLCERIQVTDFQVEHHKSREKFPELSFDWTNLFWSCSYCNGKKSSSYDNLLNPINEDIEDIIHQSFDFPNATAVFSDTGVATKLGLSTKQVDMTIDLLGRIFNGKNKIRTIREQLFYNYAISKITTFQQKIISWLEAPSEELKNAIIAELDKSSEFLGFKYWIIKSNHTLMEDFSQHIQWNKK